MISCSCHNTRPDHMARPHGPATGAHGCWHVVQLSVATDALYASAQAMPEPEPMMGMSYRHDNECQCQSIIHVPYAVCSCPCTMRTIVQT